MARALFSRILTVQKPTAQRAVGFSFAQFPLAMGRMPRGLWTQKVIHDLTDVAGRDRVLDEQLKNTACPVKICTECFENTDAVFALDRD